MDQSFTIKRGDTSPALEYELLPASVSLVGATVRFQMQSRGGETVIDEPAVIVTEVSPAVVRFPWRAGDTDTPGRYEAEFEVTYADNTRETFPNAGFISVLILRDVARASEE